MYLSIRSSSDVPGTCLPCPRPFWCLSPLVGMFSSLQGETPSSCRSSMRESFPEPSQGQSWLDCPAVDLQGSLCKQSQHFLGCLFSRKLLGDKGQAYLSSLPGGRGQVTFPWCPEASGSSSSVCLALHSPRCALWSSPSEVSVTELLFLSVISFLFVWF